MVEITRIKILRNGTGKIGVLPCSIEVEDVDKFREEIVISLDWRKKDEKSEDNKV